MIWENAIDGGVVIQGITGAAGRAHARRMRDASTPVVAGVSPGRGGETVDDVPVYDTVAAARRRHALVATVLFVPGSRIVEAAAEALQAGIRTVVALAEGTPVWEAIALRELACAHGALVLGPNTAGVIRPGCWKLGIMPDALYARGRVGLLSRSGSVMHEVAHTLARAGLGQSTCVDIGGDRVLGADIVEVYRGFVADPQTDAIVLAGEIGSDKEERLSEHLQRTGCSKPTAAIVVGRHAPEGRRMGHAAAIIHERIGSAAAKRVALERAGVTVVDAVDDLVGWARGRGAAAPARDDRSWNPP